jgi:ribonuclease HII
MVSLMIFKKKLKTEEKRDLEAEIEAIKRHFGYIPKDEIEELSKTYGKNEVYRAIWRLRKRSQKRKKAMKLIESQKPPEPYGV